MNDASEKTKTSCEVQDKPFCLAQINVAQPVEPLSSKALQGFVARLEEINALADGTEGFLWRLMTDAGDATSIEIDQYPDLIINLSVWRDVATLRSYVFETAHLELLKQRSRWFVNRSDITAAMWWIPSNSRPDVEQALGRLQTINAHGPSPEAFSFAHPWPAPFALSAAKISSSTLNLQPVSADDQSDIEHLLDACELPTADLAELWERGGWAYFLKAVDEGGQTVGAGGLEICADHALLRSVAVRHDHRDRQLGQGLVDSLEQLARERDITTCYLLTETASEFFRRRGYLSTERAAVPRAVGDSAQFSALCPASAECLVKQLTQV